MIVSEELIDNVRIQATCCEYPYIIHADKHSVFVTVKRIVRIQAKASGHSSIIYAKKAIFYANSSITYAERRHFLRLYEHKREDLRRPCPGEGSAAAWSEDRCELDR